jgi:hypothetical protein
MPAKAEPKAEQPTMVPLQAQDVDEATGEIFAGTRCELDAVAPVVLRWLWVQEHLPGIPKASENKQQGFKYRSIDDVLVKVHRLFSLAGVFVLPARQQAQHVEWPGRNSAIHVTRLTVDWQIYGANGDWITGQTVGEAADSFDKATSKAQTAAFKYLLWPSLSIADNEDNDGQTPEFTVNRPRLTREAVEEGGEALRDRVAGMEAPDVRGPDKATQPQINKIRIDLRNNGNLPEEGTEVQKMVNSFGEPGWQGSLSKLEKWQASRLIDHLNQ